jgi:hypothetical protein
MLVLDNQIHNRKKKQIIKIPDRFPPTKQALMNNGKKGKGDSRFVNQSPSLIENSENVCS